MPAADIEMAKPALARGLSKSKQRKRAAYRLPLTLAVCFVGLFLFFVAIGGHSSNSSSSSSPAGDKQAGALRRPQPWQQASARAAAGEGPPPVLTYRVVKELPHDEYAFTQGIQFDRICQGSGSKKSCRDIFWESTGMHGRSSVREVDLQTGKVLRSHLLEQKDFGEGLTRHGDRLYQVTWLSPRTYSYAVGNFDDAQELQTPLTDGWGITSDGEHLIVGDSSNVLTWLDPHSMQSVRKVAVTDAGQPVKWLNELEYIDGRVWANIWQTDCIAQIDPATGAVAAWLRLAGLRQRALEASGADARAANRGRPVGHDAPEVLNGIAYDAEQDRLFVTGKQWPRVYQIEVEELAGAEDALSQARKECVVHHVR